MQRMAIVTIAGAAAALLVPVAVSAAETLTYAYDARGRLVQVVRTGTVNNNVQTAYTHDDANNRANATTTGAP